MRFPSVFPLRLSSDCLIALLWSSESCAIAIDVLLLADPPATISKGIAESVPSPTSSAPLLPPSISEALSCPFLRLPPCRHSQKSGVWIFDIVN